MLFLNQPVLLLIGIVFFISGLDLDAQSTSSSQANPALAPPRSRLLLDYNWRFKLGDPSDAGTLFDYPELKRLDKNRPDDNAQEALMAPTRVDAVATNLGSTVSTVQADFDDSTWRQLDLPHDWAVELDFNHQSDKNHGFKDIGTAGNPNNIGWYRRSFSLPVEDKGKALWIEFDGVYRNSLVWLNGHCLGRNVSGYSSFYYDIAKFATYGGKNTLVVRVDASRAEGWFYEGAGIYRHVWLVKTGPLHVAHWGTYVVSTVQGADANISVETTLQNDAAHTANCKLVSTLEDADGKSVGEAVQDGVNLEGGQNQVLKQTISLKGATLWSLKKPYLYKLVSRVEQQGIPTDVYETPFGVRTIAFDPNQGFLLNGERVEIKGTCNHQDAAGVGSAVPDRLLDYRLERLKEMGCNAYRMSHNPPAPELLDACDRLGILVQDEHRRMGTSPEIMSQLGRMVQRDRNHPSIILWAIGNEEMSAQGNDKAAATIAVPMQDLVHKLDPTRPVTVAMNWDWGNGFSKIIDVQGFNYWFNGTHGKESGKFLDIDQFHAAFPNKATVGTEEASTVSTRGIYENDSAHGYLSAYDVNLPKMGNTQREWGSTAEAWWNFYVARPWLAGAFVWTGFDYRGEPTPYGWPCISSQFGIMDTCGFPKDNFYYYQAWWTDKPVLHIYPHWNWPDKVGKNINVWVQSNYDAVELFLNGTSLGKKTMPRNSHLEWDVPYQPGTLEAHGFKGNVAVATEKVETTGAPARLVLAADRPTIDANGEDVSVLTVAVNDSDGRPVPTANNHVQFEISGSGKIIGVGNGDPASHEADKASQRSLFNGLAQVIVQSTRDAGSITLTATAQGLSPTSITLQAQAAPVRPFVP
jgi:beta-galactosidase